MRKLNFNDLMNFMQIADMFNIQKAMNGINVTSKTSAEEKEKAGQKLLTNLIMQVSSDENRKRLFKVLAEPFEMSADEVAELPIGDVFKGLDEAASIDEWKDLFTRAQSIK